MKAAFFRAATGGSGRKGRGGEGEKKAFLCKSFIIKFIYVTCYRVE